MYVYIYILYSVETHRKSLDPLALLGPVFFMFHPIASFLGASPAARKGDAPGGDVEIWGRFYGNIWEYTLW